jgi:hypothetical protein
MQQLGVEESKWVLLLVHDPGEEREVQLVRRQNIEMQLSSTRLQSK